MIWNNVVIVMIQNAKTVGSIIKDVSNVKQVKALVTSE